MKKITAFAILVLSTSTLAHASPRLGQAYVAIEATCKTSVGKVEVSSFIEREHIKGNSKGSYRDYLHSEVSFANSSDEKVLMDGAEAPEWSVEELKVKMIDIRGIRGAVMEIRSVNEMDPTNYDAAYPVRISYRSGLSTPFSDDSDFH